MPPELPPDAPAGSQDTDDLLRQIPESLAGFDQSLKIRIGADTCIRIDGRNKTVSRDDGEADVTIKFASREDFHSIADRKLDIMQAVMSGKIQISGDLKAAMQLQTMTGALSGLMARVRR